MPKTSKTSAPRIEERGPSEDRSDDLDGYTVNFVTIRAAADLAPLLKGLPDDSCQCPHWGLLTAGRMTVRYGDRVEVIEPGDAFYLSPGHIPSAEAGTEFVQFSPADLLAESVRAMAENARRLAEA